MLLRVTFLLSLCCCFPTLVSAQDSVPSQNQQPNIVFLLADDLGWTDLHCYGSEYYETPHIDRLCDTGMRFTDAYTCGPNCAPTRACLMTGRYSPRHGIYTVGSGARGKVENRKLIPVENRTVLSTEFNTVTEILKEAGYATAHFGKWHLGTPGEAGPLEHGFDKNVGGFKAGHPKSYFSPYKNPQLPDGPQGECLTDRLADEVVAFIEEHQDRPFFAYVPFYAVHTPIQAKQELIAKYRAKSPVGGHNNPAYAAMIETLDSAVGRILQCLDELQLSDSTLVIFSSDNGGLGGYQDAGIIGGKDITSQAPLRGGKGMLYEGGIRVPLIVRWPGRTPAGSMCDRPVISVDFLPTLAAVAGVDELPSADGVNLVELFKAQSGAVDERELYWHFPGYLEANARRGTWRTTPAGAIRVGDWKLIEFFEDGRLELYRISQDVGEQSNLAAKHPEICTDLHRRLINWRESVNAPLPRQPSSEESK